MRYALLLVFGLIVGGLIVWGSVVLGIQLSTPQKASVGAVIPPTPTPTYPPMERYSFESLRGGGIAPQPLTILEKLGESGDRVSYLAEIDTEDGVVTCLLNTPVEGGTYPVIVMFRGYVDGAIYETGVGTRHAGEVLAENGFITVAPDFLGYGGSDMPSIVPLEERFQRYITGLTVINSVERIQDALLDFGVSDITVDEKNIGIWGHSNGGHIALSMLAMTEKPYPTTLWAPVSKPFPYSILYYTDEFDDEGRALRIEIAEFEKRFDSKEFSVTNYFNRIRAPIIVHQGSQDDAVPIEWSNELIAALEAEEIDVTYHTYPDDHNFSLGSWNTVVERDLEFFKQHLEVAPEEE